jgi:hypothetical protein
LVVARCMVADIWTNVLVVMLPMNNINMNIPCPVKDDLL